MECTRFTDRLEALLDGTLPAGEQTRVEAHAAACPRCRELYTLMCVDLESLSVETPGGLTKSILARTSGRACGRAQTLLGDRVDGRLEGLDRELVDAHLQQCRECSALARVLTRLGEDLPVFAELRPDAALLGDVLARTVRPARWSARWDWGLAVGRRLFERPRIAWEVASVTTMVVWLVFGASWSPLRAAPVQALALIQQGAIDTQSAGASAMAAINRRVAVMSERTIGVAVTGADSLTSGVFAGLSDRYRRATEAAPDLGRHWRQFSAAVLDRDLFSGVDALRALSRDAGAMLKQFLSFTGTTTESGSTPEQRSTP